VGFVNYVMMVLNFMKKSVQIEMNNFFKRILELTVGARRQSFDEARKKISEGAFEEIYEMSVTDAMEMEDWEYWNGAKMRTLEGYRITAIDGSLLRLENSKELKREYGQTTPVAGQIFGRVSAAYDLLNDFIVDAQIEPYSVGERKMAQEHIDSIMRKDGKCNLYIMDRGYWTPELAAKIEESGNKFLMRIKTTTSKAV
jgi:hypothetical protein